MCNKLLILLTVGLLLSSCDQDPGNTTIPGSDQPFTWSNATIYFLLTDRFYNGDPSNDINFDRKTDGAVLRNFEGGDIKGITQKIEDDYFTDLGVTAIWLTPPVEQIHGHTDEGTGKTYGYHGYWTRDWTQIDPNFGTWQDLSNMVEAAHSKGIRVIMDVVLNHTGPVTSTDSQWPDQWVRTGPACTFRDFETTVTCTLVENLPDIRTESDDDVKLPHFLIEKWRSEGRLEKELNELNTFFESTGFPRSPRHYIMKWLIDFIKKLGIDGYRIDTAKHTEPEVWSELESVAREAFENWKKENPEKKLDDNPFFIMGEVYNYFIQHGRTFDMGGGDTIDFFDYGYDGLINFDLKSSADRELEEVFSMYSESLNGGPLNGLDVINYISSHDDGAPYDLERKKTGESALRLLLSPGISQIYYGDETGRPLRIEGANGDANLRSNMNWSDLQGEDNSTEQLLVHWQKIGQFRRAHPSVGAGLHKMRSREPYVFQRTLDWNGIEDKVIVSIGLSDGIVEVGDIFEEGSTVYDYYSGQSAVVSDGKVNFDPREIFLLGQP